MKAAWSRIIDDFGPQQIDRADECSRVNDPLIMQAPQDR
jgi:hypothetical protein